MLNGSQNLVNCTLLTSVKTKTKNEKQKSVSSDWLGKIREVIPLPPEVWSVTNCRQWEDEPCMSNG